MDVQFCQLLFSTSVEIIIGFSFLEKDYIDF